MPGPTNCSRPAPSVPEIAGLERTLKAWRTQILVYFTTDGVSSGGAEAINGLLEKTHRIAHGYRKFTNYPPCIPLVNPALVALGDAISEPKRRLFMEFIEKPSVSLLAGIVGGLVCALMGGLVVETPLEANNPRNVVRDELFGALLIWFSCGLAGLLVAGPMGWFLVLWMGGGLVGLGFGAGAIAVRYIALLLCSRRRDGHWLPLRLGRFLDWCYGAGLVRVAGIGYQFRHRELQDFLAESCASSARTNTA